jgi:hypothetical protein
MVLGDHVDPGLLTVEPCTKVGALDIFMYLFI